MHNSLRAQKILQKKSFLKLIYNTRTTVKVEDNYWEKLKLILDLNKENHFKMFLILIENQLKLVWVIE
jgi:hypothetical protein